MSAPGGPDRLADHALVIALTGAGISAEGKMSISARPGQPSVPDFIDELTGLPK